jgi:hypothetical protein
MSHGDMGPALEYASLPHHLHRQKLRHPRALVLVGRRRGLHADLNAASVGDALSLPTAMPHALIVHARMVTASGRRKFLEEKQICQEGNRKYLRLAPSVPNIWLWSAG